MNRHNEFLQSLLNLDIPVQEAIAELKKYETNPSGDTPVITLSRRQCAEVLERFLSGKLSGEDLCLWADAIELREDVVFGEGEDGAVFEVVSNISSAYALRGAPTADEVTQCIADLGEQ